eukprot:6344637-Amphidinium_carterae.1
MVCASYGLIRQSVLSRYSCCRTSMLWKCQEGYGEEAYGQDAFGPGAFGEAAFSPDAFAQD